MIIHTYYNNVKVGGEMIRQNTLAHFLFRHTVEPVVLLPFFVRLGALLGLRELRSGRKGRDNTTTSWIPSLCRVIRFSGTRAMYSKTRLFLFIGRGDTM